MKKIAGLILLTVFVFSCKKDPPGSSDSSHAKWTDLITNDSAVFGAVSCSVDGKGYVLAGSDSFYNYNGFPSGSDTNYHGGGPISRCRQYDPASGAWDILPDFPGGKRVHAAGFSIGNNIYFTTGRDEKGTIYADCWKFDMNAKTWTKLKDFPGPPRFLAVGFTINGKGYIATGANGSTVYNDIYQYDPGADTWQRMADLPGSVRLGAIGVTVGDKAYVGLGGSDGNHPVNDLWQFDPVANKWSAKAACPIGASYPDDAGQSQGWVGSIYATAFALNNKLYAGFGYIKLQTGFPTDFSLNDMRQYDPATNHWQAMPSRPDVYAVSGFSFVLGNKAYVGGGYWFQIRGNHAYRSSTIKLLTNFSISE